MYRRLWVFLRPHAWRMVGPIACNVIAAVLDVFSFTLLVPFLNAWFGEEHIWAVYLILGTPLFLRGWLCMRKARRDAAKLRIAP